MKPSNSFEDKRKFTSVGHQLVICIYISNVRGQTPKRTKSQAKCMPIQILHYSWTRYREGVLFFKHMNLLYYASFVKVINQIFNINWWNLG